jgi:hypothetical protein
MITLRNAHMFSRTAIAFAFVQDLASLVCTIATIMINLTIIVLFHQHVKENLESMCDKGKVYAQRSKALHNVSMLKSLRTNGTCFPIFSAIYPAGTVYTTLCL